MTALPGVVRTACLLALALNGGNAAGQSVHADAFATAATSAEVMEVRQTRGLGLGIAGRLDLPRWRFEGQLLHAALEADFSIQPDYNLNQVDIAASWFWRPFLALQLGFARRFASPDLVAQDIGLLRAGVVSETRIARLAGISVRGAWLPLSRFNGGGDGGLGLEVGLGASIGAPEARLQGFAAFDYTRIDRKTRSGSAPLQFSTSRAGIRVRLR